MASGCVLAAVSDSAARACNRTRRRKARPSYAVTRTTEWAPYQVPQTILRVGGGESVLNAQKSADPSLERTQRQRNHKEDAAEQLELGRVAADQCQRRELIERLLQRREPGRARIVSNRTVSLSERRVRVAPSLARL